MVKLNLQKCEQYEFLICMNLCKFHSLYIHIFVIFISKSRANMALDHILKDKMIFYQSFYPNEFQALQEDVAGKG